MSVCIRNRNRLVAYHNVPNSNVQFKRNASCRSNEQQNTIEEVWCPTVQMKNIKINITETKYR